MSIDTETEVTESEVPKTTRVTFHNPETGDLPGIYQGDKQTAQEHFEAAEFLKEKLGPGRQQLFGEFAVAVEQLDNEGEADDLLELCSRILDQHVEVRLDVCTEGSAHDILNQQ